MARIVVVLGTLGDFEEAICTKLSSLGYRVIAVAHDATTGMSGRTVPASLPSNQGDPIVTSAFCNTGSIPDGIRQIEHQVGPVEVVVVTPDGLPVSTSESDSRHANEALVAAYLDALAGVTKWASTGIATHSVCILHITPDVRSGSSRELESEQLAPIAAFNHRMAAELARKGARINMIAPAYAGQPPSIAPASTQQDARLSRNPHLSEEEEVALLVAYLASDEASFITGAHVAINGGYQGK